MKINIINACSDLGVDVNGAQDGPLLISEKLKSDKIQNKITIVKNECKKSKDELDLRKNLKEVNEFNNKLFNEVSRTIKNNLFPITIGGDHSIAIGSALGSLNLNKNLGIIWIDAHLDYNTFETTITGNLHGLPLAAINGICEDLTPFTQNFYNPLNTVVVGYRANEINKKQELDNINKMGVTVFTNEDINKYGIEYIMNEAIKIASNNTYGIHISYDLDVIDPKIAPGVSVPEFDGIDKQVALQIRDIICDNIDKIKSFDLVEYNPCFDKENITLELAIDIINKIIDTK